MANRFDVRFDPEAQEILKRFAAVEFPPLVGVSDLRELEKVFRGLPELQFPINSAGELIEKLGGSEKMLEIEGVEVNLLRMIKYMPAYYFPIASMENFIEKMAELVRANRKKVDTPRVLENIRGQMPEMKYPVPNAKEFLKRLGPERTHRFLGVEVDPKELLQRVPADFFPLRSQRDFEQKVIHLLATRPLIVKD
jgi:hypothetical protein